MLFSTCCTLTSVCTATLFASGCFRWHNWMAEEIRRDCNYGDRLDERSFLSLVWCMSSLDQIAEGLPCQLQASANPQTAVPRKWVCLTVTSRTHSQNCDLTDPVSGGMDRHVVAACRSTRVGSSLLRRSCVDLFSMRGRFPTIFHAS